MSKTSKELDGQVGEFLSMPLGRTVYVRLRSVFPRPGGAKYVSKALLIAVGVGMDGYRRVLRARACESESEEFWTMLFEDLKR
ncbi:Transposase [Methanocella conradii HZ254]|uniref:Transposase n=1 Tax=Methanocella conradii (strain DSM 24694 / JCM 17849 / CGMCC 1.5162 / HZ254) TaxID=1041930 RepID=H8I6R1_METCZ|nr:Transposase [Methanocella conradii HZ254]